MTKYPQAAGAALYTQKAYRRPFLTFLVAFAVMCSGVASAATLARAFGGDYLSRVRDAAERAGRRAVHRRAVAGQLPRIKESVTLNLGLTAIELPGLLLVAAIGLAFLLDGGGDRRALEFKAGEAVPLAILSGASLAFFALIGFEDSVNVAEETKEPSRDFPPALFIGLGVAGRLHPRDADRRHGGPDRPLRSPTARSSRSSSSGRSRSTRRSSRRSRCSRSRTAR